MGSNVNRQAEVLSCREEINTLATLPAQYQQVVQEYMLGTTQSRDIARKLGMDTGHVTKIIRLPEVQKYLTKIQSEEFTIIDNGLKALRNKALIKMGELLDSEDERIVLQASKDLLDRTGHKAVTEIKKTETITIEQKLNDLINATMDDYVDAEYTEEGVDIE